MWVIRAACAGRVRGEKGEGGGERACPSLRWCLVVRSSPTRCRGGGACACSNAQTQRRGGWKGTRGGSATCSRSRRSSRLAGGARAPWAGEHPPASHHPAHHRHCESAKRGRSDLSLLRVSCCGWWERMPALGCHSCCGCVGAPRLASPPPPRLPLQHAAVACPSKCSKHPTRTDKHSTRILRCTRRKHAAEGRALRPRPREWL